MSEYNPVWTGQVLQNLGKATIELREGKYEAVVNRLLPYLTRTDYPEEIRTRVMEIYQMAVDRLRPRVYEWETTVSHSRVRYIAVPSAVPLERGQKVRVRVEVVE